MFNTFINVCQRYRFCLCFYDCLFLELFCQCQFLFVFGIVLSVSVFVCLQNCSVSVSFCLFLELFRQRQFLFVFRIVPSVSLFACFSFYQCILYLRQFLLDDILFVGLLILNVLHLNSGRSFGLCQLLGDTVDVY